MYLLNGVFQVVNRLFPAKIAHAHCDIPCGIYDPYNAQMAAHSVIRMHQLIDALPAPGPSASAQERGTYINSISRYIAVKEQHSELCKHELRILWGDYFKAEHVEKYPDLHGLFFNAMKQASTTRQQINMEAAQQLLSTTQRIAEVFWETKGAKTSRRPSLQPTGGEVVVPA